MALPTNLATMSDVERKAYHDAYHVAFIGASNPAAVALTIHETIMSLRKVPGVSASHHPAVKAMVGQLEWLTGVGLGPTGDLMRMLESMYLMGQTMAREDVFPVGNPGRPE